MAKSPSAVAQSAADQGWAALREGRWEPARGFFERDVADPETAEAFEGLSWAAWWLDDAETVFRARESAYRLYRKGGDPAGAARMATWLAADQLDFHGAVSRRECATSTRRRRQRWRARPRSDLRRLGLLHARRLLHSRARLRASRRVVRPDR